MAWAPLGMNPDVYETLHEGIPPWMAAPFWSWVVQAEGEAQLTFASWSGQASVALADEYDRLTRSSKQYGLRVRGGVLLHRQVQAENNDDSALRYADYLVAKTSEIGGSTSASVLEDLLRRCGSAWTVGTRGDFPGLERRVPEGVQVAAEAVMAAGSAGTLLAEAWRAAYGRQPDPEEAYEKAIKAVEEAGAHIVSPKNNGATLGTMVRDMENQGDWTLPLLEVAKYPSRGALVTLARALWSGQESRHGGNNYRKPTPEEAESAVLSAVALVQAFSAGLLARRP